MNYELLITMLGSAVVGIMAFLAKSKFETMENTSAKLRDDFISFRDKMEDRAIVWARENATRADLQTSVSELNNKISALFNKFDEMRDEIHAVIKSFQK